MSVLRQAWGGVVLVLRLPMLLGVLVPSRIARALTVQLMHLWSTCADVAPAATHALADSARQNPEEFGPEYLSIKIGDVVQLCAEGQDAGCIRVRLIELDGKFAISA